MQKKAFLKSPFIIAAIICFVIAITIPIFVRDSKEEVKGVAQKNIPTAVITQAPTKTPNPTNSFKHQIVAPSSTPVTSTQASSNNQQNPTSTQAPQQNSQTSNNSTQAFQVNLKINGSPVGSIDLSEGANQCDVLTLAKDQGKISSLLMKYDNSLGTHGVYQINGQGKENSIWWTYKVNGQSPSQGCSYIKANSGDSAEWEYVGN